jgi:hypothetical protein
MELLSGPTNIKKWADIENTNDDTFIDARIARALEVAENELNIQLGFRGYEIPILLDPPPTIIRDIAAKMAVLWLYESHGNQKYTESGKAMHDLAGFKKDVENWLRGFRSGMILIPGLDFSTSGAPGVVRSDD